MTPADLHRLFEVQHQASRTQVEVPLLVRRERLLRIRKMLDEHGAVLAAAVQADFGMRSPRLTEVADFFVLRNLLNQCLRKLARWMRPQKVRTPVYLLPARARIERQPLGVVGVISPWNYPVQLALAPAITALAAGNRVMLKPSELTPHTSAQLAALVEQFFAPDEFCVVQGDASIATQFSGLPFDHLVFTGSTAVGRQLGALAATHLKLTTMELGGHAPFIVCADADVEAAAALACALKFRNAGQVCASPSRFYVHDDVFDLFARRFTELAVQLKVGDGFDPSSQMGPLANARRLMMVQELIADARDLGATVLTGGNRIGGTGHFFEPTLLTDLPKQARLLNEEPFGPVAPLLRFNDLDSVIAQANSLEYGLAAFAFTRSLKTATELGNRLQAGMVSINHFGLALPETPFGGIKASGHGSEGGTEGLDAYLTTKFISQAGL